MSLPEIISLSDTGHLGHHENLHRRYNEGWVSVTDHGAVGDGVTDDTAAIRAAIDAAQTAEGAFVFFPEGIYLCTAQLVIPEYVGLRGVHLAHGNASYLKGSILKFSPAAADTDAFLLFQASVGYTQPYTNVDVEGLIVRAGNANAQGHGMHFDTARSLVRNVHVQDFHDGAGIYVESAIFSLFDHVLVIDCDYGLDMPTLAAGATISTSLAFRGCVFTACRVAARVQNANSVSFSDWCVFESCDEHAIIVDDVESIDLHNPYFENIGWSLLRVGGSIQVHNLRINGGLAVDGTDSDWTYDAIVLDNNLRTCLDVDQFVVPKASLVRMTANAGQLIVVDPNWQEPTAVAGRANLTAYAKKDKILVTGDDAIQRSYICSTAGTTAAAQPAGYTATTLNLADGTAKFSVLGRYITATATQSNITRLSTWGAAGRFTVGQINLRSDGKTWSMFASYVDDPGDLHVKQADAGTWLLYARTGGKWSVKTKTVSAVHNGRIADGFDIAPTVDTEAFVNHVGVSAASAAKQISTWTSGATLTGYVKVEVNGTAYWMPYYTAPTS